MIWTRQHRPSTQGFSIFCWHKWYKESLQVFSIDYPKYLLIICLISYIYNWVFGLYFVQLVDLILQTVDMNIFACLVITLIFLCV